MFEDMGMSHEEAFDHVGSEEMMLNIMNNNDNGEIRMDLHFLGLARAMGKSTVSLLKAEDISPSILDDIEEDQKGLLKAEDTDDLAALETKEDQKEVGKGIIMSYIIIIKCCPEFLCSIL